MILDTEEQRKLLLGILESINVPGQTLDQVYGLKKSIIEATVAEQKVHPDMDYKKTGELYCNTTGGSGWNGTFPYPGNKQK